MEKQTIGCTVHDCKHCECDKDKCNLNNIKVCNCNGCGNMECTMCGSYEKK